MTAIPTCPKCKGAMSLAVVEDQTTLTGSLVKSLINKCYSCGYQNAKWVIG